MSNSQLMAVEYCVFDKIKLELVAGKISNHCLQQLQVIDRYTVVTKSDCIPFYVINVDVAWERKRTKKRMRRCVEESAELGYVIEDGRGQMEKGSIIQQQA